MSDAMTYVGPSPIGAVNPQYPLWLYHPIFPPVLVDNIAQQAALTASDARWSMIPYPGSNLISADGASISVLSLGLQNSQSIDQTIALRNAALIAFNIGKALYFPPGVYCYSNLITNNASWIGAGNALVELRNTTSSGGGCRIDIQSSDNVTMSGISFTSPNTPPSAVNNAVETDCVLRFSNCNYPTIDSCVFNNSFGVCGLMRNVFGGQISNNKVFTCYKDAFHITGTSNDCVRFNNLVEDGGDDAFPVVGYLSGSGAGQPQSIIDCNNVVRGVKFGRAFAYVGSVGVQNISCSVDGIIPASYNRPASLQGCCAMLVYADSSFHTYGNQDLSVVSFKAKNCGSPNVYPAVQIGVDTTGTVNNLRIRDMSIKNSANTGFYVQGGVVGGMDGLYVDGLDIEDTSDPNGFAGTAGALTKAGIELHNASNVRITGTLQDTGGDGLFVDANVSGEVALDLRSYRINKGNKTGSCRIISLPTAATTITKLSCRLYVAQQAVVTVSGSQYFLSEPIIAGAVMAGKIESMVAECDASVGAIRNLSIPGASTSVAVTASPQLYTNTSGAKQFLFINAGTATGLALARGQAAALGNIGRTAGWFTLVSGESMQITYTTAGTMTLFTHAAEGF